MESASDFAWLVGIVLTILFIIGFFSMWSALNQLVRNTFVLHLQLDQLLRAQGVKDPRAERQAQVAVDAKARKSG